MPTTSLPEVLTLGETARVLRVSTDTVRRMIDRGDLKALRVGRAYRVLTDDLAGLRVTTSERTR